MDDPIDISFELTRDDWLSATRLMFDLNLPAYIAIARAARRRRLRSMLFYGPLIITVASLYIGSRTSTRGMYVEGAIAGSILVGLMLMYFGSTRQDLAGFRRAAEHRAQHTEYGDFIGPQSLRADAAGITQRTRHREMRQNWTVFESVTEVGPYLLLHGSLATTVVIPRRAFPTPQAADDAAAALRRWLDAGRAPPAARIAAYLADRDLPCPTCTYNLRGISSDRCPECGAHLTIEALQSHAASQRSTA